MKHVFYINEMGRPRIFTDHFDDRHDYVECSICHLSICVWCETGYQDRDNCPGDVPLFTFNPVVDDDYEIYDDDF